MNWGSLSEFIDMGGYAVYVWGSYGAAVLLVVAELLFLRQRRRRAQQQARLAAQFSDEHAQASEHETQN